jgi:MFS family permease
MRGRQLLAVVLVLGAGLACLAAPAAAQSTPQPIENKSDYYNNETGQANMTNWVPGDGNVTLTGALDFLARVPGMFVGNAGQDPSGTGYVGVLLTALLIVGGVAMGAIGTGVGPVGGAMLGMVLAMGLSVVGLVPAWLVPLLLFAVVGVPVARAILDVFQR